MGEKDKAYVEIYDTTLRDGTQAEDVNLSVEDKIQVALKLDELGIDYIEGGWPGSNPKDVQFFREIRNYHLGWAKIAAFGSTHMAKYRAEEDPNLRALIEAQTPVITIFGKTWDVHVRDALRITLERNLELIRDSLAYLRPHAERLFYDAEHFFDGFKANSDYALATLKKAIEGGADCLVLCDTNGGTLPQEIAEIIKEVRSRLGKDISLGIHAHNDSDTAVANSLMAVSVGARHVQGTINGFGERCGNANLCSIIPGLVLKMGFKCKAGEPERLRRLTEVSRFVFEIANLPHNKYLPYVGRSAFAHKGGVHVSAVSRNPETYEHIRPELVGNSQRILISDLAGKSNVLYKARQFGISLSAEDPVVKEIVVRLKERENEGYQYEAAEASFELLMRRIVEGRKETFGFFDLISFRVLDVKRLEDERSLVEATVRLKVRGEEEHTAAVGNGPVNALDNAVRKALLAFYPELADMELEDYKVRVLAGEPGTAAKVRVLIQSKDGEDRWGTVGVSHDIIEASWQALVDAIIYKLLKSRRKRLEAA
ncbi:citramalate synthase [Thermosulfuriphilus ammonigenes]|uniref:Citramalate synthase n=1 Tax=Thermosulfuriphilus ammonigenes TaxID=1936021 RepID=A0A6G7PWL2_9BACT|nr:citramalate synthase [Thermosulfuriphilus ammonigenes]MBA2847972.1 2-isopropylmalate synthase [Thermosulfuriphilus ammonigenes]QIJ71838.1 citramalate synthase [Thermosulfuriphilus ammonigenes]